MTFKLDDEETRKLKEQLADARLEINYLKRKVLEKDEALREIAKGAGPYRIDPLEHAASCIEAMKELANEALKEIR